MPDAMPRREVIHAESCDPERTICGAWTPSVLTAHLKSEVTCRRCLAIIKRQAREGK